MLLQKTTRRHFYLLVMIYCFKRRHSYLAVWYVPSEDDKTTPLFTGMMYCFIRRQDDTFIWQYDVPFIRRQDDTFIYWYDMPLHRTTRRHFYLLPYIIPVNNPLKAPGDFQKNPPYPGVLNVQLPAPIPRHGVGSPGDDGAPPRGWHLYLPPTFSRHSNLVWLYLTWLSNKNGNFYHFYGRSA